MKTYFNLFLVITLFGMVSAEAVPGRNEWEGLAKKGDVKAMISLGVMYHAGNGVKVDYNKAMDWYLKAYAKNDGDAVNNIIYCIIHTCICIHTRLELP